MAPKRKLPLEEPVAASSSEEEETSSSTEGEEAEENEAEDESGSSAEEEEEEEEEPKRPTPAPAKQTKTETLPKKQVQKKLEPEPEPATESESESDSEQPNFTVKPITSKPMENAKPRPKPPASSPPAKQTPAKRGSQVESDSKETKRSKKKDMEHADAPEQPEDATKTLFQRVWSEADEIHVLEGLIRFKEEKGTDPTKNMDSFFDYIKKNLNFDVSLSQLKDKVWRLKRKYQKHKGKKIQKPHERQAYDLWERIWGDIVESSAVKANGNAGKSGSKKAKLEVLKRDLLVDMKEDGGGDKKEVDIKDSGSKEVVNYGNLNVLNVAEMEEYVMKRGLDLVGPVEKAKMQEEWKKLHIERLKFLVKKNELVNKQVEMMLAAYEAGES